MTPWYNPTAVYLVFRFLAGYFGAAFLSVAGGSVSAMFPNSDVATYVALASALFLFVWPVSDDIGQSDGSLYNLPLYRPRDRTDYQWVSTCTSWAHEWLKRREQIHKSTLALEMDVLRPDYMVIYSGGGYYSRELCT